MWKPMGFKTTQKNSLATISERTKNEEMEKTEENVTELSHGWPQKLAEQERGLKDFQRRA